MCKIELTDTVMDCVVKMSEGNPGAATALAAYINFDSQEATGGMLFLDMQGIYGSSLYVLWNDQCGRDIEKFNKLLTACCTGKFDIERLKRMAADQCRSETITAEEFEAMA